MPFKIKSHRLLAFIVLIAAGLWVGTGHFASVGSEAAKAETASAASPADTPDAAAKDAKVATPALRTIAAMTPAFFDHQRRIRLSAVTTADKRVVLAARASGIIAALNATEGDTVDAGATIIALEGPELFAAVATAEAALRQAQQQLDVAEKLYARGNTPELQLTAARATKAAAESQLSQARAAADRLTLVAPFAGVVDSVDVQRGEWVQPGATVATILALDPIVVRGEVNELDVPAVTPGARAEVRLVDGSTFDGTVRFVAREASGTTRTFPVEVALANPDHMIPAGMTAEVSLFAPPVRAVKVPRSIITLSSKGEIGLRVVGADNVAHFVAVTIIDDTTDGLIVSGVAEGMRIVVAGQDLVEDGEKVIVAKDQAAP